MSDRASVLLIDDSDAIRALVLAYCSGHLNVKAVSSQEEAIQALQEEPFDLILLDIELQGIDGFAVFRSLKESLAKAGLPRPPVLALSAHDGSEFISELIQAGFAGRIRKPFQKKYLLQVLGNHLLRK